MIVSPNRNPAWTEDRSALLFGIQKLKKADAKPGGQARRRGTGATAKPDTALRRRRRETPEDEKVDLVLWHWQDKRLQSQQQVQETLDRNFSYLADYRVRRQEVHPARRRAAGATRSRRPAGSSRSAATTARTS